MSPAPLLSEARGLLQSRSVALNLLALLAVGTALHFMAGVLIPVAFSILLYLLFLPLTRFLKRGGVPYGLSASMLVLLFITSLIGAVIALEEPAAQWLSDAPTTVRELQRELQSSDTHIANIKELADEVDELATPDASPGQTEVVVTEKGIMEIVVGGLPTALASVGVVLFLTYFLLSSGDGLLRRITKCGRTYSDRRRIVTIARQIQDSLSRYLLTVTAINAALGAATAAAMYLLDVPNPLLWGAVAYLFNFAPYLGALATASILTLVGITTFDELSQSLAVPGVFLVLTIIEGQVITPTLLGRRMSLNTTLVFLSVVFWGWLWGIFGALMAVPFLTCLKVASDHIPRLHFLATFLHRDPQARTIIHGDARSAEPGQPASAPIESARSRIISSR